MTTLTHRRAPGTVAAAAVITYVRSTFEFIAGALAFAGTSLSAGFAVLGAVLMVEAGVMVVLAYATRCGSAGARTALVVLTGLGIFVELFTWSPTSFMSIFVSLIVIGLLWWNDDANQYFLRS